MLSPSQASSAQGSPAPNSNGLMCEDGKKLTANAALNILKTSFEAIIKMERTFSRLKTNELSFPSMDGGQNRIVDRNDMKIAKKEFIESIRLALKPNPRNSSSNEPTKMTGQYTPVILGPALQTFFNTADFGPAADGTPLINKFPTLKQGFALQKVIYDLLNQYVDYHKLKDVNEGHFIKSDQAMLNAFNNRDYPALWLKDKEGGKQVRNTTGASTYDILASYKVQLLKATQMNRPFDAAKFNPMINFRRLVPLNTYNIKHIDTPGVDDGIRNTLAILKQDSATLISEANVSKETRFSAKEKKEVERKNTKQQKPALSPEEKAQKKQKTEENKRSKRLIADNKLACKN